MIKTNPPNPPLKVVADVAKSPFPEDPNDPLQKDVDHPKDIRIQISDTSCVKVQQQKTTPYTYVVRHQIYNIIHICNRPDALSYAIFKKHLFHKENKTCIVRD